MEQESKKLLTEYHIDAADRLIFVDERWREFARDNAASELADDLILHKPLWDFITGHEVQHLYQMLLRKIRQSGNSMQFSYRCDAPHARRFLHMKIVPDVEARLQFYNWLIREEKREPVPLLDLTQKRSEEIVIICSWCKRVQLDDESWAEVEEAVTRLGLFEAEALPQLSHGMCTKCAQSWSEAV